MSGQASPKKRLGREQCDHRPATGGYLGSGFRLFLMAFVVSLTAGLFAAILPLVLSILPEEIRRSTGEGPLSLMSFLKVGLDLTFSSYVWALVVAWPNAALVAGSIAVLSAKKSVWPWIAPASAFSLSIVFSAVLGWRYLICQCHPNLMGYHYFKPVIFVSCHLLLVATVWFVLRAVLSRPPR